MTTETTPEGDETPETSRAELIARILREELIRYADALRRLGE